jgi:hypothetical protein
MPPIWRTRQSIPTALSKRVINVKLDLLKDHFMVELSSWPASVSAGDAQIHRVKPDEN